jgi:hypothetical protein
MYINNNIITTELIIHKLSKSIIFIYKKVPLIVDDKMIRVNERRDVAEELTFDSLSNQLIILFFIYCSNVA